MASFRATAAGNKYQLAFFITDSNNIRSSKTLESLLQIRLRLSNVSRAKFQPTFGENRIFVLNLYRRKAD